MLVAAAILLWAGQPAVADTPTGNELLSDCRAQQRGFCLGFVMGYIQGISNWQATEKRCFFKIPIGVTVSQAVLVVQKYMAVHPERLHEYSDALIDAAIHEAFPCK